MATALTVDDLKALVADFRAEYAVANNDAVRAMDAGGWELLWHAVVGRAADELCRPGADAFAVRRRLERLADWHRRALCDPVRLFGSLRVQEAVVGGLAQLERWCADVAAPPAARPPPALDPWRCVRQHPDVFADWPVQPGPAQHDPRFQWRIGHDLYASPHDLGRRDAVEVGAAVARAFVAAAATGETLRLLDAPADAARATGLDPEAWCAHRTRVLATHGRWVDVEGVATRRCGLAPPPAAPAPLAAWRAPLRAAEAAVRAALSDVARAAVVRWLDEVCGCGPEYLGVRWPPAFTSLLCDAIAEQVLRHPPDDCPVDPVVAAREAARGAPAAEQVYTVWLRYGFARIPTPAELTRDWTETDHAALADAGGRLTRAFLRRFA